MSALDNPHPLTVDVFYGHPFLKALVLCLSVHLRLLHLFSLANKETLSRSTKTIASTSTQVAVALGRFVLETALGTAMKDLVSV